MAVQVFQEEENEAMNTLWITLIVVFFLASFAKAQDFQFENGLTVHRVRHDNRTRLLFCIIVIVFVFVAGCRYYVGSDFGAYYHDYRKYIGEIPQSIRNLNEPVIRIIYRIATYVWDDGWACIFSVAAVTLILELRFIYINTTDIQLASILFVFIMFSGCFNAVRQALALAVVCCGFPYIRERRFKPFLVTFFIAFLCHRSAIIIILVYFFAHRKLNLASMLLTVVGLVIVLWSYGTVFNYVGFLTGEEIDLNNSYWANSVNVVSTIVAVVPFFAFWLLLNDHEKNEDEIFYLNLLFIHASISIITMNSTALARLKMYTESFQIIAYPELLKKMNPKYRRIITYAIIVLYGFIWWYSSKDIVWHWMWERTHVV